MPPKQRPLIREGDKKQTTEKGLEIPVPTKRAFLDTLRRATRKEKPPRSAKGKRRTSRSKS